MIWDIGDAPRQIEGLDELGRPDPAYAASLGLIPAPFGRRVLATVIEVCILLALALPGVLVATPALARIAVGEGDPATMLARGELLLPIILVIVSNVLVTVFVVVQLILLGRIGLTVGKAAAGLRSVNVRTLEKPGFWRGAVVRYLLMSASFLVPLLGPLLVVALSPLFDAQHRGRGWLDQASAIWTVDSRRGLNPYDVKRMRIARKSLDLSEHEARAALPSLATPVERDAPAAYIPSARFSGGVIGVHRAAATAQRTPDAVSAARTAPDAAPAGSPAGGSDAGISPFAPPAVPMSAVPPVLPQISLLGEPPAAPVPEPVVPVAPVFPAPAPAPASAPAEPAAPASAPAPAVPASAPAPAPTASAPGVRATIVLDDGRRIEVRGATLFGRAPAPVAGEGAVQLVPVADETRSVSKTHLALLPSRRGVVAVDRGSTNGSSVTRGGVETPLPPGDPVALQTGDVVRFGDRTMTVERA